MAVADEVGELKTDEGISKITSGQVNTEGSRFIEISTSYQTPDVPFHRENKNSLRSWNVILTVLVMISFV